jgi:hypothetical protein
MLVDVNQSGFAMATELNYNVNNSLLSVARLRRPIPARIVPVHECQAEPGDRLVSP